MPDNPSPAARSESSAEPTEFNFDKPAPEIPRIKRRSLKAKSSGLQPATNPPPSARELERAAPPHSAEAAAKPAKPAAPLPEAKEAPSRTETTQRSAAAAPPKTTPVNATNGTAGAKAPVSPRPAAAAPSSIGISSSLGQKAAIAAGIAPATGQKVNIALNAQQKPTVSARPAGSSASPHGTRPATLYYTSQPKKEASNSMKPTNNASPSAAAPTSSASSASTARPAQAANASVSAARPVASTGPTNSAASTARPVNSPGAANVTSSASRPTTVNSTTASRPAAGNFDYRANVERQSREQKSVGNILAYVVYGIGFFFFISVVLASYGAYTINRQLHDQATSISSLDDKYAGKVADLGKQLATTQDNLNVAQAQINRAQDLINKQEDEINQLHAALAAASSASSDAVRAETRSRSQEAASLRARIRDLEYRLSMQQSASRVP